MDYVSHVEELMHPILAEKRPNWGYVEKFDFVEQLIKFFGCIEMTDEELITQANKMLE